MSGSIKITGKSEGGQFMLQNKKKITIANYMKSTGYTAESFLDALTLIVDFLDIVSNTLKKCTVGRGLYESDGYSESYERCIYFPTYDDKSLTIGYVNNFHHIREDCHILDSDRVYFLDSDFIYQRYLYFYSKRNRENASREAIDINHNPHLGESDYYAYLFNMGVIESFQERASQPLKEITFVDKDDLASTKKCFRISCGTLWNCKF